MPRVPKTASSRPALQLLSALRRERDAAGILLVSLIAAYALCVAALALSPPVARTLLARFHLRTESFAVWALGAPMPWMYNFENRFLVSERPLSTVELEDPLVPLAWEQANHQPARAFTFADGRARFLAASGAHYFYLESRYRDQVLRTTYLVRVEASPKGAPAAARVTRVEPPP